MGVSRARAARKPGPRSSPGRGNRKVTTLRCSARHGTGRRPTGRPQVPGAQRRNRTEDVPAEAGTQKQHQGAIISRVLSPRAVSLRTGLRWQPFIWAVGCPAALAANPGLSARNTPAPLAKGARPLFGLAPGGVCHAVAVAGPPVRFYRTLSPLPVPFANEGPSAVCSLWHFPLPRPKAEPAGVTRHPCFVEPGLSSRFRTRLPQAP